MKNLRNFGITLAVSLVVLAVAAIFACSFVADTVSAIFTGSGKSLEELLNPIDTDENSGDKNDRMSREITGESFTWLWVVSDYRPDDFDDYYPGSESDIKDMKDFGILGKEYRFLEATNIVLVHADVKTREYLITTIPAVTRVSTAAGDMSLGRVYALGGASELCEKVETMTGIKVDYCTVIHSTDLSKLANTIGGVTMTLPVDIYTDGKNFVSAPKAETTVDDTTDKAKDSAKDTTDTDGEDEDEDEETTTLENELDRADSVKLAKKLMSALLYYDSSDGITDEMTILQSFARGVMDNISECSDSELTAMLTGLDKTFVSNNVTSDAVILSGEVIRAFTWFDVQVTTYPGRFVSKPTGAYYNPDVDEGVSMFYKYR